MKNNLIDKPPIREHKLANYVTVANLIILLTFTWNQSGWQKETEKDIETLKAHAINETLHMPFDKKIQVFVPRVELDERLESIKIQLDRIEKKLSK